MRNNAELPIINNNATNEFTGFVTVREDPDTDTAFVQLTLTDNQRWEKLNINQIGLKITSTISEEIPQPHRIIIKAAPGIWFYVNDDIRPIILDSDGFLDWDTNNLGQFFSLQFIKPNRDTVSNIPSFQLIFCFDTGLDKPYINAN